MRNRILLLSLFGIMLAACNRVEEFDAVPQDPTLFLDFELMHDGKAVSLDDPFIDQEGVNVNVTLFRFFLANIKLTNDAGEEVLLSEVEFIDFEPIDPNSTGVQFGKNPYFYVPEGDYRKISFGLGLPPELNLSDPTDFENEDPLSTYTFMHWSWATQYRFIVLEAKADVNGGSELSTNFIFHTGLDELYEPSLEFEIDKGLTALAIDTIHFQIDWDDLFYNNADPFTLDSDVVTHTTDNMEEFELARQFTDNFVEKFEVRN